MSNRKLCLTVFVYCMSNRKLGLTDSLVRCLHKGKTEEQAAAAVCSVLLAVQLGAPDEELYNTMAPPLKVILSDDSASLEARAAVSISCQSLSFNMTFYLLLVYFKSHICNVY